MPGWHANKVVCAANNGAGTGKTKTILGLLSVLACAVPADSPQLLRAAGAGGAASSSAEAAAVHPTRRDLTARASPWLVRSAHGLRWLWTPRYSGSNRAIVAPIVKMPALECVNISERPKHALDPQASQRKTRRLPCLVANCGTLMLAVQRELVMSREVCTHGLGHLTVLSLIEVLCAAQQARMVSR